MHDMHICSSRSMVTLVHYVNNVGTWLGFDWYKSVQCSSTKVLLMLTCKIKLNAATLSPTCTNLVLYHSEIAYYSSWIIYISDACAYEKCINNKVHIKYTFCTNKWQIRCLHLPMDKMAAISQTIFSYAFSWETNFVFWLKFIKVCS